MGERGPALVTRPSRRKREQLGATTASPPRQSLRARTPDMLQMPILSCRVQTFSHLGAAVEAGPALQEITSLNSWECFSQQTSAGPSGKELGMRCYHPCPFVVHTEQHRTLQTVEGSPSQGLSHPAAPHLCSRDLQRGDSHGSGKALACPEPGTAPPPHAPHVAGQEDYKLDESPSNVCN